MDADISARRPVLRFCKHAKWGGLELGGGAGSLRRAVQLGGGANGVMKPFACVSGSPEAHVQFTDRSFEQYTLFSLCRYADDDEAGHRGRILGGADGDWFSGFWKGHRAVSYHRDWVCAPPSFAPPSPPPASACDWLLSTDYPHHYRCNGLPQSSEQQERETEGEDPGPDPLPPLGVNFPHALQWERSHFRLAEVLLFDRVLPLDEIEAVEALLAREYGLRDMLFN